MATASCQHFNMLDLKLRARALEVAHENSIDDASPDVKAWDLHTDGEHNGIGQAVSMPGAHVIRLGKVIRVHYTTAGITSCLRDYYGI